MQPTNSADLRVAVVGCGQIADAHLQEIAKLSGASVVAVCDREPDLAYQAAARFGVSHRYEDIDRMLAEIKPDVVHVTTPPHTHLPLASTCLENGAHTYVEKPLAINADETSQLLRTAVTHNRLVCVGHDHVFDPVWKQCLTMISEGRLGTIVHVESEQGYDPGGAFGRLIQTDPRHWIHRLPGGIFQNVISHAVCKVTPFLLDDRPETLVMAFGADKSSSLPTELRVVLKGKTVSANITLLSRSRPVQRVARVYGTRQAIEVDFDAGIIRKIRSPQMPGPFGRIETPLRQAAEAAGNATRLIVRFVRSDLQYFTGMRTLFEAFYSAIRTGGPPPISYNEIQRVANIMDAIFENAACGSPRLEPAVASGDQ